MQEAQGGFMHPRPVSAVDERNEAAGIRESTARSSGVEACFILSCSLQSGSGGQGKVASGGDLQIADSGDASGTDCHEISTLGVAAQEGNVLFRLNMPASAAQQQSPGAAELVMTAHAWTMSTMMDMSDCASQGPQCNSVQS